MVPNKCFSCSISLFSRLMGKAGFSQCICTMFWGCGSPELCIKWLVTSFCPCRLDLSLSHRAQTCQSNIPGQGFSLELPTNLLTLPPPLMNFQRNL